MISRSDLEWLDAVAEMPEQDLPCNSSTVAFAVRLAVKLRGENRELLDLMDQIVATRPEPCVGQGSLL